MADNAYIVAGCKPWNWHVFEEQAHLLPGRWYFEGNEYAFTKHGYDWGGLDIKPRYIFFLHWSAKVPSWLLRQYECIGFHMTALPFGKGGSPLQNLIARGFRETVITAFRMTEEMDSGPVYLRQPLSLEGLAEEIYIRATRISLVMAAEIAREEIQPVPQDAEEAAICGRGFKRRTPEQSEIPHRDSLLGLFDHIRMLDADSYPRAYLDYAGYRYTFSRPALRDGRIVADVEIKAWEKKE